MSVFVDANVFIYAHTDTAYGGACRQIMRHIARNELDAVTSVLVAEEIWHVEMRGPLNIPPGSMQLALDVFDHIVSIDIDTLRLAMDMAELPASLGTADRIHTATCHTLGITRMLSADRSFDGIPWLARVDPTDANVAGLLRA